MSKKINFSDTSTPDLLAFMNIYDNLYHGSSQLANECSELVNSKKVRLDEIEDIGALAARAREEQRLIAEQIQSELDKRLAKTFGTTFGIRKTQSILVKLEERLAELQSKGLSQMTEEYSKLKLAPNDNTPPAAQ